MKPSTICLAVALTAGLAAAGRAADKPLVLDLWPSSPPGAKGDAGPEKLTGPKGGRLLTNVSKPTLTVFRPARDKDTGVAVVIAPGGAYRILAWDHEGLAVAAWLNTIGVTGVLLKYRVPVPGDLDSWSDPSFPPRQDAQRALSLVRSKAKEWGIDPHRVGMLGFSAGGHLTALAALHSDKRSYEPIDPADRESCRPDFAVIIYPGGVVKRGSDQLAPAFHVTRKEKGPPAFLAQCSDDPVGVENSVRLYLALERAGVPAELHVYTRGGHGFGLRPGKGPASEWPKRCEEWLRDQGILRPAQGR
jgi:acetyl esterase/lipase